MVEDDPLGWVQYRVYDYDGKRSVDNQPMGKVISFTRWKSGVKKGYLKSYTTDKFGVCKRKHPNDEWKPWPCDYRGLFTLHLAKKASDLERN